MTTKMDQMSGASFTLSPQSPSFTTYSSENVADVAARVVRELNLSHEDPFDDDFFAALCSNDAYHENDYNDNNNENDNRKTEEEFDGEDEEDDDDDESEFEFAVLCAEDNSSPISADEIFSNGQIKPMFPIFNTDLVYGYTAQNDGDSEKAPETIRLPLRKLFQERDRESSSSRNGGVSCSSSEGDDLEGVPPGTYCVWTPKKKEEVMMRKKSKSTGSSKRWRFKDLLYRSNSDGKDTFVFLTPSVNHNKATTTTTSSSKKMVTIGGKKKMGGGVDGGKKKSYLPYRQDLVGFFANVNGISRTVRPF